MAYRFRLVAAALAVLLCPVAHAGYAQLATPSGFGGSPAGWTFAPSANDQTFGRVVHQPNGLKVPVPGTTATMPASYRLASNAPRIAAAVIFANPWVRVGAGIAAWLLGGKLVWDEVNKTWHQSGERLHTDGFQYRYREQDPWVSTHQGACAQAVAVLSLNSAPYSIRQDNCSQTTLTYSSVANGVVWNTGYVGIQKRTVQSEQCPEGWTASPAGCLSPQLTQPQMVEILNPANQPGWPMPETVPRELPPGTPLPVEQPVINPAPGPTPSPRPLFVPTGNPVPNPNYDPQQAPGPANQPHLQPGVRVVPTPTPSEPWRVDIQPVNRPVDNPDPNPEPQPEDDPNGNDKPKPEEQQSLCEKHPDVVACAKTGTVEAVPVPNEDKQLAINKDSGYGPESGTCPQPKTATVMGQSLAFKYDLLCDFSGYIKPIVIAFAWLSAALTFFGFSRKDS